MRIKSRHLAKVKILTMIYVHLVEKKKEILYKTNKAETVLSLPCSC